MYIESEVKIWIYGFHLWSVCVFCYCGIELFGHSSSWPCGGSDETPKCFQNMGSANEAACVTSCTNAAHYENTSSGTGGALNTGKCTLRACAVRTVNVSTGSDSSTPCGPDECFWDQGHATETTRCIAETTTCSNPNHFTKADSTNRTCLLLDCASRTANERLVRSGCGVLAVRC
jgi:hypothetical protein